MHDCKNCIFGVFDEQWGEYKCKAYAIRIYDLNKASDCKLYKPEKEKNKTKS